MDLSLMSEGILKHKSSLSHASNTMSTRYFAFIMEDEVRCIIDDGTGRTCSEYIATLPAPQSQQDCIVNLVYFYDFTNVGTICDDVEVFSVEMGDGQQAPKVFTPDLTPEERDFCPGEQLSIPDPVAGYDVCSLASKEVCFDIELNGMPDSGCSSFPPLPVAVCGENGERTPTTPTEMTFLVGESCTCDENDSNVVNVDCEGAVTTTVIPPPSLRLLRYNRSVKERKRSKGKGKGKGKGSIKVDVCRTWIEFRSIDDGSLLQSGFYKAGDEVTVEGDPTVDRMTVDIYHLINDESPGVPVQSFSFYRTCVELNDQFGCMTLIAFSDLE